MSHIDIKARLRDGSFTSLPVEVSERPPWTLRYQELDGNARCIEAHDLFEAFREMRSDLEAVECQLLCVGARPDVFASNMSRTGGVGGRKVYIIRLGTTSGRSDLVDIFDYADTASVGTVREQRTYYYAWVQSLKGLGENFAFVAANMASRYPNELTGNRAIDFAERYLRKVGTDLKKWEGEYEDPHTGARWIIYYPDSSAQGGGCPHLRPQ